MKLTKRRQFLSMLGLGSISLGAGLSPKAAQAHHTDTHFENESTHKLVYQCNKADHEYIEHLLFSCGEMLRKYGDDIELVIAAYGPGLNLLAKRPKRGISKEHQQRARSLAEYGVRLQACGNTMKSMRWEEKDIFDQAVIVPIGVDGIMLLQEKGFSYIAM
ncbi:MAG: DsrE family protein [Proteobacteria bacterium]|nr:DsrE family protein [Pseudomonadota bacterium]